MGRHVGQETMRQRKKTIDGGGRGYYHHGAVTHNGPPRHGESHQVPSKLLRVRGGGYWASVGRRQACGPSRATRSEFISRCCAFPRAQLSWLQLDERAVVALGFDGVVGKQKSHF